MRRILGVMLVALVVTASTARAGQDIGPLGAPEAMGDQLIYYYDARTNFTTFFTLVNGSSQEQTVSILFYGPTFSTPFSKAVTVAASALTIVDVGSLRGDGLPAQPGVAIATAVNLSGQSIAAHGLAGNFTVANLLTGSAFGAPAAARSAFHNDVVADKGEIIDDDHARFQVIRPQTALLASYYDPTSLAPVANGGNQLIFINFEDQYGPGYSATIGSTTWDVNALRGNGSLISSPAFTANGVTVTDIASVVGPGANGEAGTLAFTAEADTPTLNRLIYFTESLGTYGTGYLLPQSIPR